MVRVFRDAVLARLPTKLKSEVWLRASFSPATLEDLRQHFDPAFYLSRNTDVAQQKLDPFWHFMRYGWKEGRDPSPQFSVWAYLDAYPDLREANLNPLLHWIERSKARPPEDHPVSAPTIDWLAASPDDLEAISDDFDADWYLEQYPEVAREGINPAAHYLLLGWTLGHDPAPWFSTRFYLETNPDVRTAGLNPFMHYCKHGRSERRDARSYVERDAATYRPLVSIIVPCFNHATYVRQRFESIAAQTYDNYELIVLDDGSSDGSPDEIRSALGALKLSAQTVFNEHNSGNVFAQWRRGVELARGDLIWICESDDFCEPDFLERLVPQFVDMSVTFAFGRVQFVEEDGTLREDLDLMREAAEPGIWHEAFKRPAAAWFDGCFGVRNVAANVGGCLFRRQSLPDAVWETACSFRIAGDWYLYLHLAGAGQIAFDPGAIAYFRQHGRNTSSGNLDKPFYFEESGRILSEICRHWEVSEATREKFLTRLKREYQVSGLDPADRPLAERLPVKEWLAQAREKQHIQLVFLGFQLGGGEIFPIALANALAEAGHHVSMMAVHMDDVNDGVRARLSPAVPVYHASDLWKTGRAAFLDAAGVTVLHTHVCSADALLFKTGDGQLERPCVATLHGSYSALEGAPRYVVDGIIANVSRWVFLTDSNLDFFRKRDIPTEQFIKLPNALPLDPRPAPFARSDLGIGPDDIVFLLASRAIEGKGWRAAVRAMRKMREAGRTDVHLLLAGEGPMAAEAATLAEGIGGIHFLGYRSEIDGILGLSDVLLLPSRFDGESYPLILIQGLQRGVPALATVIGEIPALLEGPDGKAGVLVPTDPDDDTFVEALSDAMKRLLHPETRAACRTAAKAIAPRFDMAELVGRYEEVYAKACDPVNEDRG